MYENEKIDWKRQVPTGKAQVFIHQLSRKMQKKRIGEDTIWG